MSVPDEQAFKEYDCDGATTQFPITFSYLKDNYLLVQHYDKITVLTETLTLDVDFSVVSDEVNTTLTYPVDDKIYLSLNVPNSQEEVLLENGVISSELLNFIHDKLTLLNSQSDMQTGSALRLALPEVSADMTLPDASERADTVVSFDSSGDAEVIRLTDLDVAPITDFCAGVLTSDNADEFREAVEQGTILSGTSDPTINIGVENDFYINLSTLYFFGPKTTTWPAGIRMNGIDGVDAIQMEWQGSLASAPGTPEELWAYYNTTDNKSYIWDKDSWEILAQDGIDGNVNLPIGFVYFQLPGKLSPSDLSLTGTWSNISTSWPGDFLRIEGGAASTFNSGQQTSQNKTHTHIQDSHVHTMGTHRHSVATPNTGIAFGAVVGYPNTTALQGLGMAQSSTNYGVTYTNVDRSGDSLLGYTDPGDTNIAVATNQNEGGSDLRPVNRTIRVWERVS